jgi:hypothetical protein
MFLVKSGCAVKGHYLEGDVKKCYHKIFVLLMVSAFVWAPFCITSSVFRQGTFISDSAVDLLQSRDVKYRSRDSSVGIATVYGLDFWGSIPGKGNIFPFRSVQTGSGAHYVLCPGAIFPGVERLGHEADNSHLSAAEVKNGGTVPPLPHMPSWHNA